MGIPYYTYFAKLAFFIPVCLPVIENRPRNWTKAQRSRETRFATCLFWMSAVARNVSFENVLAEGFAEMTM